MSSQSKWAFLTSPRFWQLFLVGLTAGLNDYSSTSNWKHSLSVALGLWLGGSVVVRTVDRATEQPPKQP